ncbi:MAG: hypothetical protein HY291_17195 [Planctomycetes bacterium]|nr:hypothetical protein [Planctomycetota bacterium]
MKELEKAAKSGDIEIQKRATKLVPFGYAWKDERIWKASMAKAWPEALKEGKLAGPLLGALAFGKDALKQAPATDASAVEHLVGDGPIEPEGEEGEVRTTEVWIPRMQRVDGHWDALQCGAQYRADLEQTALALLSIISAGHTEKGGRYKVNVQRAVKYLIDCQREDGAIVNPGWNEVDGVAHELAALALCEAAGMGGMPTTIAAAQKATDYSIQKHQCVDDAGTFGFGREVRSKTPDLLTTTLAATHLKSAKITGKLKIDPAGFEGIIRFLDKVEDKERKTYRLVPGGKSSPEAAFIACVARQFLGWKRGDLTPYLEKAVPEFKGPSTGKEDSDVLINWLGTLSLFHQGGDLWKDWNQKMKASLVEAQRKDGAIGSWDPSGQWSGAGRVFATSLNVLCLSVYYRSGQVLLSK